MLLLAIIDDDSHLLYIMSESMPYMELNIVTFWYSMTTGVIINVQEGQPIQNELLYTV